MSEWKVRRERQRRNRKRSVEHLLTDVFGNCAAAVDDVIRDWIIDVIDLKI
jgi:hypothetical protein